MVAPAHAYACEVCGRPLSAARVRQGVRVHKECRRDDEKRPAPADAALLERVKSTRARDPELRELFALAAKQARELAGDLERLRALAAGAQR